MMKIRTPSICVLAAIVVSTSTTSPRAEVLPAIPPLLPQARQVTVDPELALERSRAALLEARESIELALEEVENALAQVRAERRRQPPSLAPVPQELTKPTHTPDSNGEPAASVGSLSETYDALRGRFVERWRVARKLAVDYLTRIRLAKPAVVQARPVPAVVQAKSAPVAATGETSAEETAPDAPSVVNTIDVPAAVDPGSPIPDTDTEAGIGTDANADRPTAARAVPPPAEIDYDVPARERPDPAASISPFTRDELLPFAHRASLRGEGP